MSEEKKTEKPADPYQRYKDFKWQNPDQFKNGPIVPSLYCCSNFRLQERKTHAALLFL